MFFNTISRESIKKELQDNLDYLSTISVEEYTLYRKWIDLNIQKWSDRDKVTIGDIKSNIWKPLSVNDYMDIKPSIVYVESKQDQMIWKILRNFTHSGTWKQSPGRLLKFYVIDDVTKKYLGIMSFGSDFISIGGRDEAIGWNIEHKLKSGMLNHTMMASTISPTQPLGYNFLGGKLIALLCASNTVEDVFNKKYKEKLAGITTTSLYGGYSQYTNLDNWKKCKSSNGMVPLEPTEDIYVKARDWLKTECSDMYNKIDKPNNTSGIQSHTKSKALSLIYKELDIKTYQNNASRGVYWCPLYKNTNEFLRMEHKELVDRKFDNTVECLTNIWKEKYASKRVKQNKKYVDILSYDDIIGVEWCRVKEKYLKDVGR